MPKLSDIRRIIPEDFKDDERDLVEKISGSYNDFADEVYQTMNGQLDFDNLARSKSTIDITFTSSGVPTGSVNIATNLTYVSMVLIGRIQNVTNPTLRLTIPPFISWTYVGNGIVKIDYGLGFVAGNKYRLTLEIIQ